MTTQPNWDILIPNKACPFHYADCLAREWKNCNYEECPYRLHNNPTQEQVNILSKLQMWRLRRMTVTLKKDVWIAWNEETDYINTLLQQEVKNE